MKPATKPMKTSEGDWIRHLAPESADREAAVGELRSFLIKGVRSGLHGQPKTDEAFIEDVVQMALIRILDHLGSFEGRSAFTTWALAIALRVAYSELRRKHWNNVSLDELRETSGVRLEEADTSADPIESSAYNSLISLMHQLVSTKVTLRQRDVLLAELSAMPHDEIARQLKITRNAVYKLSHDARKALRRALETAGYTVERVRDALASQTR